MMTTLPLFADGGVAEKNDSSGRQAFDTYLTPAALSAAICRSLSDRLPAPATIIEPSAGSGSFVRAARATWPKALIHAFDIRDTTEALQSAGADMVGISDWLSPKQPSTRAHLILGNPPFRDAQAHIETSLERLEDGGHLALLLRLSILGSVGRAKTLWSRPGFRALQLVAPRPSYVGEGNDSADSALFIWEKGRTALAEVWPPLLWQTNWATERAEFPGQSGDTSGQMGLFAPKPCLDPDKMLGAGDQFPGSDFD